MTNPEHEAERLRERIAVLEESRSCLMAYSLSPRKGQYDDSLLTDSLRLELERAPSSGVLLETVEVEIRCLRKRLAELKAGAVAATLRRWQMIDHQVNVGQLSPGRAVDVAIEAGLARRTMGPSPSDSLHEVWAIEPARGPNLVPGPLLLIGFEDGGFGGPRIYRPVSDEQRFDTGLFAHG